MLIRLCWAFALFGATCMAQNANQAAHAAAKKAAIQAAIDATSTLPPKTGNPNIDYQFDPNLPIELHGYDLSKYPFYDGLPADLLDPALYNFTCDNRLDGFYASVHHQCQVYHNCLFGLRYDFVCANYTVFSQKDFICQYVSLVDCAKSADHFDRNEELYVTTTDKPKTTERPFRRRPEVEVVYVDRPVRTRPNRPRPSRPFFSANRRPAPTQAPRQPIDDTPAEQPAGGRRPSIRRPPAPAYEDYEYDYNYDDYYTDSYYGEYYDYADETKTTTTTTTTTTTPPPPPQRRRRPQGTRLGPGRRPGAGNRIRPNIRQNNEPEVRRPVNRRRPAVRNTTPADPFYDYNYDYDNQVSDEPPIPSTTLAPVLTTRRPTRTRFNPRQPEPTTEEVLIQNDQETDNINSPSIATEERRPVNGRRPFRPAPEESSAPRRTGGGSVVNARRQPFRPAAEESSPRDQVPAREPLGSGRRQGPSFPSRRKPTTTQAEEPVNEEVAIEEDPSLALGSELTADDNIQEESPVEDVSIPRRTTPVRRIRVGGRQRPQRQSPAYRYYNYYDY